MSGCTVILSAQQHSWDELSQKRLKFLSIPFLTANSVPQNGREGSSNNKMAAKAVQITNVFVLCERAAVLVVLSDNREVIFQNSLRKSNHEATQNRQGTDRHVKR